MKNITMKTIISLLATLAVALAGNSYGQIITTVAGTDSAGYNGDNIAATAAQLLTPTFVAIDATGNIYVSDYGNSRIRKISTSGIITTIAGTGTAGYNGDWIQATDAQISNCDGITLDNLGNLYISDDYNNRIRKVNSAGIITTIAGTGEAGNSGDNGPATAAKFSSPHGIAVDNSGNVYFADYPNNCVRKVNTAGIITTIAGQGTSGTGDNGLATAAKLSAPYGIAIDGSGNLYIAEYLGSRIRKINSAGIITTIAGTGTHGYSGDNGPATAAQFRSPTGIAVYRNGNLYTCDAYDNRVRRITGSGIITTISGTGTGGYNGDNISASSAELHGPMGIALDAAGDIYIAEFESNRIRRIQSTVFVNNLTKLRDEMSIYPNPSSGRFTVRITSEQEEQVNVYIMDMAGRRVKEVTVATNKPEEVDIVSPPGVYFVTAVTNRGLLSSKINFTK